MITETFTQQLSDLMAQENVPGISLALIKNSEISEHFELGFIENGCTQTVNSQTLFQGASLAKPVTAFAALGLVESGLLSLDEPLWKYLPNNDLPLDDQAKQITTRHILSHTAGFPNWRFSGQLQLYFPPGQRFSYSGEGYQYIQQVIEYLAEEHLDSYVNRTIFKRFNMGNSLITRSHDNGLNLAVGHDSIGKPLSPLPKLDTIYSLYTSSLDFATFMIKAISPSSLMLEPQIKVNDSAPWQSGWPHEKVITYDDVFWALGWGIEQTLHGLHFWHWGDNPGFKCFAIASHEKQNGLVVFTNGDNGRKVCNFLVNNLIAIKHPALDWLESVYA